MANSLKKKWQTPGVILQPEVYQRMQAGINKIVGAIRPTLGPLPRVVVNEQASKIGRPEMLDDGAIIARRIIQLPNREEDMGAMFLRHILWKQHEKVGDGTATAAVIFQTIYNEGIRYIASGGDAMRLRRCLESAGEVIEAELDRQVFHLEGKEQLGQLAETICHDHPLAKMLGEIFDIIGEYGLLDLRTDRGRQLEREYVEGMYWDGGVHSREMIPDPVLGRVQAENARVLSTDLEIREARELLPLLDMVACSGCKSLLLVAATLSEQARAMLSANQQRLQIFAVKAPALDALNRNEALEDLALLTGGKAFFQAAGDTLNSVHLEDLGHARRAWADAAHFGVVGGRCDPRKLRTHIAHLRAACNLAKDPGDRKRAQQRIGRFLGGSAILWTGANTPVAMEIRKALAERTAEAMRGAIREGVVPGGGAALLGCKKILEEKKRATVDSDERMAYHILLEAVEVPIRALIGNAGYKADEVLARLCLAGEGAGFDVLHGKVVNMREAGIYDSAAAVKAAVFNAIHGAALALTVDVLVHRRNPPNAYATT